MKARPGPEHLGLPRNRFGQLVSESATDVLSLSRLGPEHEACRVSVDLGSHFAVSAGARVESASGLGGRTRVWHQDVETRHAGLRLCSGSMVEHLGGGYTFVFLLQFCGLAHHPALLPLLWPALQRHRITP